MRIAIIGRTEVLYETTQLLLKRGYEIPLIITCKEAPEYLVTANDYENLAEKINAEYIYSPKLDTKNIIDKINSIPPIDIAVSINYSGVISGNIINLFKYGILNAHAGDLPRYRGNACQAWAIINGEDKSGLCIHKMIGGELDSGNIISKKYFPISINTKVGEIYAWSKQQVPIMMLDAIDLIRDNPDYILEEQSKDPGFALRCYPRKPEDGKIDWSKSNEEILRLINASSEPYAGAFCEYDNKKLIIWAAEIFKDDEIYLAISGQVSKINYATDGSIIVICGNGKLKVTDIELDDFRGKPAGVIKSIRTRLS